MTQNVIYINTMEGEVSKYVIDGLGYMAIPTSLKIWGKYPQESH